MSHTRRSALAVALGALLAVGGCTVGDDTTDSGSGGGAEITFLTFETPNLTPQYWDAAIKRITDKHTDIRVKKLVAPSADRTGYAKQLLASGQFPDVMLAVSPAEIGAATNLYAWQPGELGEFLEPTGGAIDGKVYQLPTNTQTIPNVYYRKSMFTEAGITAPPTTYAELLDASAKLKAKGHTPFVVGGGKEAFPSVLPLTATVATEVYRQRKDWMDKRRAGDVTFTDPAFVKALSLVRDLSTQGYIDRKMISLDYAATEQAFLKGRGAMYPMGSWFAAAGDKSDIKADIGVFAWPTADGAPLLPAYTGGGLEVSAKSKNLEAAKKFALAFQLDKDNLDNSVRSDALFPAIKGYSPPAGLGPVFTATYELWQKHVAGKSIVKAFSWETGSDSLLPGMTAKVYAATQDVILGKATPEKAAERLDTEWSKAA